MKKLKIYEVMQKAIYRFPTATGRFFNLFFPHLNKLAKLSLSRAFQLITIPNHVASLYL